MDHPCYLSMVAVSQSNEKVSQITENLQSDYNGQDVLMQSDKMILDVEFMNALRKFS